MLEIFLPEREIFDDEKQEFVLIKAQTLNLEHSLVSLSKWESKWCKPFLSSEKNVEQTIDYIKCMTLTQNVKPEVYLNLSANEINLVKDYIDAPMTATWFNEAPGTVTRSREVITAEIIYYWMIAQNIPFECQKWHLNRLITLIKVCGIKNAPPKKTGRAGRREMFAQRQALNAARRAQYNTRG